MRAIRGYEGIAAKLDLLMADHEALYRDLEKLEECLTELEQLRDGYGGGDEVVRVLLHRLGEASGDGLAHGKLQSVLVCKGKNHAKRGFAV